MKLLSLILLFIACTNSISTKRTKIGVFSGTFNPPHIAHIELVKQMIQSLDLDKLYLIVNPSSHHKKKVTGFKHRLNMSRIAFSNDSKVFIIDKAMIDAFKKKDMSGVLLEVRSRHPQAKIIQVMGADSYFRFKKVKNKLRLKNYELAICIRDNIVPDISKAKIPTKTYKLSLKENVSSSKIRSSRSDSLIKPLLSPGVFNYIKKFDLYR